MILLLVVFKHKSKLQNSIHGNRDAIHFPRTITQIGSNELILSEIQEADFATAADCTDGTCSLPSTQHMQIQASIVLKTHIERPV